MSELLMIVLVLAPARVLTLPEALKIADRSQPALRQAHDATDVAIALSEQARAPLLPQVNASGLYQRKTANFAPNPGSTSPTAVLPKYGFSNFNYWAFGVNASQLVYDFNQTIDKYRSTVATAESQAALEGETRLMTDLSVRTAYFNARAQRDLVKVQKDTLENQDKHLGQIEGFVKVGTRPEIDLAQARTDRANALVALITAENNYDVARAQLGQAIGLDAPPEFEVADETIGPLPDENEGIDKLLDDAWHTRPEVVAADKAIRSADLALRSAKGGYGPAIGLTSGVTDAGPDITNLAWNFNFGINIQWSLFSGLLNWATVKQMKAQLDSNDAAKDIIRLSLRLEVDQARVAVRGAKAALGAAGEAEVNAKERLRLAEGRYQAGVGSVIELGDAQVALTNAAAQQVTAEYNLATARAQLLKALGRR